MSDDEFFNDAEDLDLKMQEEPTTVSHFSNMHGQ
jgi:hypothetical protein